MAPVSQKADLRPISFTLQSEGGEATTVPLIIRPEDLRFPEVGLETAVMTFGGGWVDNWGRGLTRLQISGHTGWGAGKRPPGEEEFRKVREAVWTGWYKEREAAVANGKDPQGVKLIFTDALDNITVVVSPGAFTLMRNRSRPLLMMYQISMTVVSDRIDEPLEDPLDFAVEGGDPTKVAAGVKSLSGSLAQIQDATSKVRSFVEGGLANPVGKLMELSGGSLGRVLDAVNGARGMITAEVAPYVGIAKDLAQVSRNVAHSYAAVTSLGDFAKYQIGAVGSAFENAYCVLENTFRMPREFADYSGLYGAAICSSTVGGSPISSLLGGNPWEAILPVEMAPVSVSPVARSSIEFMKFMDPVLKPLGAGDLSTRIASIVDGVQFR